MATIDDENDFYSMNHKHRGRAFVINNQSFEAKTHMNFRRGSDVDARQIGRQLQNLDFDVHISHNLKKLEMLALMNKVGSLDHSNADCVAVVILSHGMKGVVYGSDNYVEIENLLEPFRGNRCPSLVGKPKLFFIQACRGDRMDDGVNFTDADDETDASPARLHRIPTEADFLIAYSVVPGFYSWRHAAAGSWFIQALVAVLEKFGRTHDILTIMTKVNRMVAYDFESRATDPDMCAKKQIPSVVSMLTKRVLFKPKTLGKETVL